MRRAVICVLALWSAAAVAAGSPYLGQRVAAVIEEFRAAGLPLVYSTNLVGQDMLVQSEPAPGEALDIVRQILRPYGLTVRTESGVHLVVRADNQALAPGGILVVITSDSTGAWLPSTEVSVDPGVPAGRRLDAGVHEYTNVAPGRYRIRVDAAGFDAVRRVVDVWPGQTAVVPVKLREARPEIETIAVSASRYEISRDVATSSYLLDQLTIQNMPDLGEDPVRAVQRLPGAASSGASARTHLRGGEAGEVGIVLNGERLFDPFHIRDYQSVFSTVDSRAIDGIEVYTGGFPVQFGNRMSGMVLMETLDVPDRRHTEVGLSVFNTSILSAGYDADRHWVLSARRGNLDLVIDPKVGTPSYHDLFGEYAWNLSPSTTLSLNALYASDRVEVILESDPVELERALSHTQNAQFWLRLDNRWSDQLSARTILSGVSFSNHRKGSLGDYAKVVANVSDDRDVTKIGFRQDYSYTRSDRHHLDWGLQVEYSEADYAYSNAAEYYGLQAMYAGRPDTSSLTLNASPNGAAYALYLSHRLRMGQASTLQWGLRWDDQTYTGLASDAQLSPRLTYLYAWSPKTELRFSWGRYFQPQEIHELQVEDGIAQFWPAQRADHLIAGIRHLFRDRYALRVELFDKQIGRVRPRFENLFDPLRLIPEVQRDRVRLDPTAARSRGLEISVDAASGAWNWWASYVLSEATDRIDGRDELRSWDQRHAFQGGLGWSNGRWDVSLAASVHTGWPLTELTLAEAGVDEDGETVYVAVIGDRNAGRHPDFASLDARISRTWKLRRGSLMAFIEVANLTNRQNECCLDFDYGPDEDTGEIFFERGVDYWTGLLPAIGILWEF